MKIISQENNFEISIHVDTLAHSSEIRVSVYSDKTTHGASAQWSSFTCLREQHDGFDTSKEKHSFLCPKFFPAAHFRENDDTYMMDYLMQNHSK